MANATFFLEAQFTASKAGKTGLSDVVFHVYEHNPANSTDNLTFLQSQAATEVGRGLYRLYFTGDEDRLYSGVAVTADATVDMKEIPALAVLMQRMGSIDADVSSRLAEASYTPQTGDAYAAATLAQYQGAIWVNGYYANTNTVLGVDGLPTKPVSTISAALTLATALNTNILRLSGVAVPQGGDNLQGFLLTGWSDGGSDAVLMLASADAGALDTATISGLLSVIGGTTVQSPSSINGGAVILDNFTNCMVSNSISCQGAWSSSTVLFNCNCLVEISLADAGVAAYEAYGITGRFSLSSIETGNTVSLNLAGGSVTIQGTGGTVTLSGFGDYVDDSGGAVTIDASGLMIALSAQETRDALKLAPTAGAADTGSVDDLLAGIAEDTAEIGTAGAGLTALGDARLANLDAAVSSRPDAAGIRSAVGLASANLDTQLAGLPTAEENADAVRSELATELGRIDATISSRSTLGGVAQTGDSYSIVNSGTHGNAAIKSSISGLNDLSAADVKGEIVDAITTDLLLDSVPADGAMPTLGQAVYMILQFLIEKATTGTSVVVKKPDGTTTLMTLSMNDATNPSSITRTG